MADVQTFPLPMNGLHNMNALCPTCSNAPDSQTKIDDLENEVRVLTDQSVAAANKLAAYEEEIATLRQQRIAAQREAQHAKSASVELANNQQDRPAGITRFASFRYGTGRKASPTIGGPDVGDLQSQLAREIAARQEAERKVDDVNNELEDLSAQLFEEANEMVATERRARSKLEEQIAILEKRDKDKTRRLDKIEAALTRLDRVKALLGS